MPGIIKNPVEGQTAETIKKIDSIVKNYIKQPNTIILAIGQASIDVASFESLQIARDVDAEGERTIGVITKIDCISEDCKDMVNTLEGNLYPLKYGFVGMKNRTKAEVDAKLPIEKATKQANDFYEQTSPYKEMSSYWRS